MTRKRKRPARRRSRSDGTNGGHQIVPLYKRSSSHFRKVVRERGIEHLDAGDMQFEVEETRVRARVDGDEGQTFAVGVDWSMVPEKRALHTFCNCRLFASGEACEHVWATLLALDESSPDSQPPGADRLSVRKDQAARWPDLGVTTLSAGEPKERVSQPYHGSPRRRSRERRTGTGTRHASTTSWRSQFAALHEGVGEDRAAAAASTRARATSSPGLHFLVNTTASRNTAGLVLDVFSRRPGRGDKSVQYRRASIEPAELSEVLLPHSGRPDQRRVEVIAALPIDGPSRQGGAKRRTKTRAKKSKTGVQRFRLPQAFYEPVLTHLSAEGALGWWDGRRPSGGTSLAWDASPPWHLALRLEEAAAGAMNLVGSLERNGDSVPLTEPLLILPTGEHSRPLVFFKESISRLETGGDLRWIKLLRDARKIVIPHRDVEEAFAELYEIPDLPRLEIPKELGLHEETSSLRPRLVLTKDAVSVLPNAPLVAELSFLYGDREVSASDARTAILDQSGNTLLRRDMQREHELLVRLLESGARPLAGGHGEGLELSPQEVPMVVEPLLLEGWDVEFHGDSLRVSSPMSLRIESEIDWFELSGGLDFDGDEVDLAAVLDAVSKGDRFVKLADGSRGLLTSSMSETLDSLADLAQDSSDDGLRFFSSQALLVDALLTDMPPAAVDGAFAELRDKLRSFEQHQAQERSRADSGAPCVRTSAMGSAG